MKLAIQRQAILSGAGGKPLLAMVLPENDFLDLIVERLILSLWRGY